MNNMNVKLHKYQRELIKKLILARSCQFNELLIEGLESEHMNYHLKQLIDLGFVKKSSSKYTLTDSGKDYSNLLDDEVEIVEKQPKTSVIIRGIRKNAKTGEIEHLLNRRLREPYYGKVGRLTGKVKFGETVEEATARELLEETGLQAKTFVLDEIYRKMRHREDGTFVQDVFFYIVLVKDFKGTLIEKTKFQENFWISEKDAKNDDSIDLYDDFEWVNDLNPRELKVTQNLAEAEGF